MFTKDRSKLFGVLLLLVLAAGVLASCSSGGGSDNKVINADLTTYKMTLDKTSAPAGEVSFHVKNSATDMTHEFVIFKTDLDAAQLPKDDSGNVIEDQLTKVDEVELEAGKSGDLKVNLDAGHYVIVCNQPGHYSQGMYTNFTVQ